MISNDSTGAQCQRTRDGAQGISEYLASLLPQDAVKLDSPVHSITQHASHLSGLIATVSSPQLTVATRSGTRYTAEQVVCTTPSPLCSSVVWSPPLPGPQRALVNRAFSGVQGKCITVYPTPWWRHAGWSGTHQSSEGPMSEVFDTCDGDVSSDRDSAEITGSGARQYSLTGFIAGRQALEFFSIDKSGYRRKDEVMKQLSRMFNNHPDVPRPSQILLHDWTGDEFSQGAPCPILPTGALGNYGSYYGKRHGQVWFAGSEYSSVWQGYMEGAIYSGREVAEQVLQAMR